MTYQSKEQEAYLDHTITKIAVVKTTKGIGAGTLVHNDRDEVIVNHREAKTFTIYDQTFEKLRSIEFEYEIFDMALTSSGEIIATADHEVDRVIRITPSGDPSTMPLVTVLLLNHLQH